MRPPSSGSRTRVPGGGGGHQASRYGPRGSRRAGEAAETRRGAGAACRASIRGSVRSPRFACRRAPKDLAVTKLRNLVEKEQDKHSKAARIQRELDGVKALMDEKKYPEVIAKTKELLGEFPAEPNFIRLSEFAAERQTSIEKEKLLQQAIEDSKAHAQAGRFPEAVRAAQDGLRTFPGDAELQALQQEATAQQKKQEVRRQIEQRVRDIRVKINREQLSDAIDLAKKTLATLGPTRTSLIC